MTESVRLQLCFGGYSVLQVNFLQSVFEYGVETTDARIKDLINHRAEYAPMLDVMIKTNSEISIKNFATGLKNNWISKGKETN